MSQKRMEIIDILKENGMTSREAKTYLALLELGSSTTGQITKKTKIPSSKIYEVLERLIEKGLVSYVIKKHQKHFQAANPEEIVTILNEKRKKFEEILPKLKEKQEQSKNKQKVELYEEKKAIFNLIHTLVNESKRGAEYLSFSVGFEHLDEEIVTFYTNLTLRRKEKRLKIKVLTNEKIKEIYKEKYSKEVLKTINNRFTKFNFPQGIIILGGNLIMVNWKNPTSAIKISSKTLTQQYREFFYELYSKARA